MHLTYHTQNRRKAVRDRPEIEVTPEMVAAGLQALSEHSFSDELPYVLESVYRAMAYARALASRTS